MRNKGGLSTIVATLLVILITLVAIGIIWVVIRNVIQSGTEQVSLGKFTLDLEIKDVVIDPSISNFFSLTVRRNSGEGDISGLKFIIDDGNTAEVFELNNFSMKELEQRIINVSLKSIENVSGIKKISVVPIFKLESGKEINGDIKDEYEVPKSSIISGGITCFPNCIGRNCGLNGCGGVCGVCASGYSCQTNGTCTAEDINNYSDNTTNITSSCVDSDGGNNTNIAGRAYNKNDPSNTVIDNCGPYVPGTNTRFNFYAIHEAYCAANGTAMLTGDRWTNGNSMGIYECPYGCSNGACLPMPECYSLNGGYCSSGSCDADYSINLSISESCPADRNTCCVYTAHCGGNCGNGYECIDTNNTCMKITEKYPSCNDSDAWITNNSPSYSGIIGLNYYTKGHLEGRYEYGLKFDPAFSTDRCYTPYYPNVLLEHYCKGNFPDWVEYTCPNGCSDGACIQTVNIGIKKCINMISSYYSQGYIITPEGNFSNTCADKVYNFTLSNQGPLLYLRGCSSGTDIASNTPMFFDCKKGCLNGACI